MLIYKPTPTSATLYLGDQNNFESLAREATTILPCSLQFNLAPQGFQGTVTNRVHSWGTYILNIGE